jgi:uncharacterized protein DUF6941
LAKSKQRKTARKYQPPQKTDKQKQETIERLKRYASAVDVSGGRTKARLLSLLFCDYSSMTDDRKMNLLGIFDRIFVHPEHRQSGRFVLYGRTAETFEDSLWVRVFDPDNEPSVEIKIDPTEVVGSFREDWPEGAPKQFQFAIPIQVKFQKSGTYWFDIAYRDYSLGGTGLVVEFRKLGEDQNATDAS